MVTHMIIQMFRLYGQTSDSSKLSQGDSCEMSHQYMYINVSITCDVISFKK